MIIHPLAAQDIADIWEYIAQDNAGAAKKVREELQKLSTVSVPFLTKDINGPI